jgi:hypothetical protein
MIKVVMVAAGLVRCAAPSLAAADIDLAGMREPLLGLAPRPASAEQIADFRACCQASALGK